MSAAPPTTAEVMAVAMSRELQGAELVQLGLASALGQTSAVLAKHLAPDGLLLEDPAALTLSDRPRRARLTRSEAEAEAGCILHFDVTEMVGQVMPNVAGRMRQFIRPLQVDAKGRINTYRVARKDGSWLRVAGLAGLAEVAEFANPFLLYIPGQDLRGFVEEVDFCVCAPLEARAAMGDARIVGRQPRAGPAIPRRSAARSGRRRPVRRRPASPPAAFPSTRPDGCCARACRRR